MTALIRSAEPTDAPRLGEVHVLAWQWAYRGQMPDDLLDSLRPESRAKAWATWLTEESPNDFASWVAEVDGEVVGFAASSRSRDEDVPDQCAELLMIYLLKEHLGTGIGSALLSEAESYWRRQGYELAVLWVLDSNAPTRKFYERHGWQPDGSLRDHPAAGEQQVAVRYTKLLD